MTEPAPLPGNALAEARVLLHAALADAFDVCGFGAERADPFPPATIRAPGGWVDAPTLSAQGHGLIATFPLVVAVDSTDRRQLEQLDAVLAAGWQRLEAVSLPNGRGGSTTPQVLSAGPDDIDLGGISTRAVVFTVQIALTVRTLCPVSLTSSDDTP